MVVRISSIATDPEYKASWNEIYITRASTRPDDKSIQTPHSDTPPRAEPLVLSVPDVRAATHAWMVFALNHSLSDDDNDNVAPSV